MGTRALQVARRIVNLGTNTCYGFVCQSNAILGNLTFSSRLQVFSLLVVYESWSGEKWKKKVGHFVPTFPGLRPRTTVTATRRVFRQGFPLASFRRVGGSDGAFATRFFIRVSKPSISNSPAYSKLLFANWYSPYHFFGMDEKTAGSQAVFCYIYFRSACGVVGRLSSRPGRVS